MFGRFTVYALGAYSLIAVAGAASISKLEHDADKSTEDGFWETFAHMEIGMSIPVNPPTMPPGR
jgi:hypothetical protein